MQISPFFTRSSLQTIFCFIWDTGTVSCKQLMGVSRLDLSVYAGLYNNGRVRDSVKSLGLVPLGGLRRCNF